MWGDRWRLRLFDACLMQCILIFLLSLSLSLSLRMERVHDPWKGLVARVRFTSVSCSLGLVKIAGEGDIARTADEIPPPRTS